MTNEERKGVERFWQLVRVNEDYIRQYANAPCPDAAYRWDKPLEEAYERIRPILRPLARERFFLAPADLGVQAGPFVAETAHQALMFLLNPPEALFGCIGVLSSPEYLRIRKEAEEELRQVQDRTVAGSAETSEVPLEVVSQTGAQTGGVALNQTQEDILAAVDSTPRRGQEVATRAGYGYDLVRRHLPTLIRLGFVKHGGHGYYRP